MSAWSERPRFALDADVTVYWPDVRPCWEPSQDVREATYGPETDGSAPERSA